MIKDFCLSYIVKEDNIQDIVMSDEFAELCKPLMIEVFRKRFNPVRSEIRADRATEGCTLENDLAAFLKMGGREFCDIQLLLDGKVVRAHKSILAARCTYFQAMFRSFMPPDNRVQVQIGDISPSQKAFQSLLRYIYYGEKKMPAEDSLYLFSAPCFYGTLVIVLWLIYGSTVIFVWVCVGNVSFALCSRLHQHSTAGLLQVQFGAPDQQ